MIKKLYLKFILAFACIAVALVFLLKLSSEKKHDKAVNNKYLLTISEGSVALYHGNELVAVYDGIRTENLPVSDRKSLTEGIEFSTRSEAESVIEDFDG